MFINGNGFNHENSQKRRLRRERRVALVSLVILIPKHVEQSWKKGSSKSVSIGWQVRCQYCFLRFNFFFMCCKSWNVSSRSGRSGREWDFSLRSRLSITLSNSCATLPLPDSALLFFFLHRRSIAFSKFIHLKFIYLDISKTDVSSFAWHFIWLLPSFQR